MTEDGDADKLGRCAIWNDEIPGCIHQNYIFCVRPFPEVISEYFETFINSPACRSYFLANAKQTTNLASINMTILRNTPIVVPPFAEQKAIVALVDGLLGACDDLQVDLGQREGLLGDLMKASVREVRN